MNFNKMSAREIAAGVREKKFPAAEVFEACLSEAEKPDSEVFTAITAEAGRKQAGLVDARIAKGESPGRLAGVPVVLSDNICVRGLPATAGIRVLEGWDPPYDAEVWSLLAGEGAALVGKSDIKEFDSDGFVSIPWGGRKMFGLKPTYGLVSRSGLVSSGSSLQQIGVTGSAGDIELLMGILARRDPKDSTNVSKNIDFSKRTNTLKGRHIAIVKEFTANPCADMKHAARVFAEAGAEVAEISLPLAAKYSEACYGVIMASEAFTNFARYDGVRYGMTSGAAGTREMFEAVRSNLDQNTRRVILAGTCLARPELFDEYYTAAVKARTLIAEEVNRAFESVKIDCILHPVSESKFTRLAGLPELSFGAAESVRLTGQRWGDGDLLDIGFEAEKIWGRGDD